MRDPASLTINDGGVQIWAAGEMRGGFEWGIGEWTLRVVDTRLGMEGGEPLFTPTPKGRGPRGFPRVMSLDPAGRDEDRRILGLIRDPQASPILLTNPAHPGTVTLHYGPLHAHQVPLGDGAACELIEQAFKRGFEVRRSLAPGSPLGHLAIVSTISTKRAAETKELEVH